MYNNSFTANPYQAMYQQPSFNQLQQNNLMGQKQEVVRVNGKNGAQAYQMPPNSSILLLDVTAPIVWLKITDGAGYPTITPYDISPHKVEPVQVQTADTQALQERIIRLENIVNELNKSDAGSPQPIKRIISKDAK